MKSIWKFELNPANLRDPTNLRAIIPTGAKLLTAQGQNDKICVWAEVDTDAEREEVLFEVFGTGHEIPEQLGASREYVGTAQIHGGALVFHVYRWTGI